ncbi:MAG: biosynthetic arginine decarboxylase [Pseudomonadales bacterium]|nr:biosynthetic arginine decarboxylase [Pseudomonadales bacterium]
MSTHNSVNKNKSKDHQTQVNPDVYNIPFWSDGYFGVDAEGEMLVQTHHDGSAYEGRLTLLLEKIEQVGLRWPVLVRFSDILHDRVQQLCCAFSKAMTREQYTANFTAVYPVKVNQQRRVVEEIIQAGRGIDGIQVGLEAGSKPELLAVLALSEQPNDMIVCNGYKDREYVRLALMGSKLKRHVTIVVEKMSELELVLTESGRLAVEPCIGVRIRLTTVGKGNWQNTGGEKSKFGLSAKQILILVARLKKENKLHCLQMLHFHMGSQISNAKDIQRCVKEAGRFFSELHRLGAPINYFDVGGGLGVDYEGTRTRSACSMNYSIEEYAQHIVHGLKEVCDQHNLDYPNIISESGRALTAHHAVLITKVIDVEKPYTELDASYHEHSVSTTVEDLRNDYRRLQSGLEERDLIEVFHNLSYSIEEVQNLFIHNLIGLEEKSLAEQLFYAACHLLRQKLNPTVRAHQPILEALHEKLACKLFCNFSVFQSIPDVWGIDQVFPIVPLVNLSGPLLERGKIQDITCDSDGRVDQYVDGYGVEPCLPLPEGLVSSEDAGSFFIGVFMVGAYQEILGDMHNLFGDTDSVDVSVVEKDCFQLNNLQFGDTVEDVLEYVNFNADDLRQALICQFDQVHLNATDKKMMLSEMLNGLQGYTYLE